MVKVRSDAYRNGKTEHTMKLVAKLRWVLELMTQM
jgi:hypothetical protein